ncbi:hypothetical protein ZIOFF_055755 [Zingiber officinale]|uniref:Uncharacterized protein n=1 Tax=Zingiber officinale TaxID=94328 RepID=A0A8J5KEW7_ZINOF|nr:hypothetical protein ZIOFF_055755 [Zingiber officinale]
MCLLTQQEFLRATALAAERVRLFAESIPALDEVFAKFVTMYPEVPVLQPNRRPPPRRALPPRRADARVCLDFCGFKHGRVRRQEFWRFPRTLLRRSWSRISTSPAMPTYAAAWPSTTRLATSPTSLPALLIVSDLGSFFKIRYTNLPLSYNTGLLALQELSKGEAFSLLQEQKAACGANC